MMNVLKQSLQFLSNQWLIELRLKYALSGLLLYVLSTVFVIYFSLVYQSELGNLTTTMWAILFWVVILFATVNAAGRSFYQDSRGKMLYYYTLLSPQAFILGKILYNCSISIILSLLSLGVFSLIIGSPIENLGLFILSVLLGAIGYSSLFTLVSSIAAKAGNSSTLGVILGFPLVIPLIIYIVKLSQEALKEEIGQYFFQNLIILIAFIILLIVLSLILFPYIWRE